MSASNGDVRCCFRSRHEPSRPRSKPINRGVRQRPSDKFLLEIVCVFSNARARHEFLFVSLISFDLPPNAFVITSKAFVGHTLKTCGQISLFSIMRCLGKQRGSDLCLRPTYIRTLECNPCACRKPIGWRLTANRAMLICNERTCQAHCVGGWRSVSVAGSDRGRDLNVAAANHCSATNRPQEAILRCHRPVGVRWSVSPLP
jgi:hypothetical protein